MAEWTEKAYRATTFDYQKLSGLTIQKCTFERCEFLGSDLAEVIVENCTFHQCNFRGFRKSPVGSVVDCEYEPKTLLYRPD